jgi:protein-disulfide isomerase
MTSKPGSRKTRTIDRRQAHLSRPVGPDDHAEGPPEAPLTLVEYGDYQCSTCGEAQPIVAEVRRRLGSRLRFVFRHFPLEQHQHARHAALAAESAASQARFWPMHHLLFAHQKALEVDHLTTYAAEIGLDVGRFAKGLKSRPHAARVRADIDSGLRSGVQGTPTFFVNGVRHDDDWDPDSLIRALKVSGR